MSIASERLAQYLAAEKQILLTGQAFTLGERTLTRANLDHIRSQIDELQKQVNAEALAAQRAGRPMYGLADFSGCSSDWSRD